MADLKDPPILVTGAHRSGTTWVGKMLAAGNSVAYVSEPLNVWHRPGVLRVPIKHWYTYICRENQSEYYTPFQELLDFEYHTALEIESIQSLKDFFRMSRDWWTFREGRQNSQRPLLKDPFAVFSTDWFRSVLGCRVVVVVRHPAAVASSLKKLNWDFDFQDLIDQPLLMRDWLEPYRGEMEQIKCSTGDLIAQSSLLWRMVYQTVSQIRSRVPDLIVIRHEDLSRDVESGFRELYQSLDLEFSDEIRSAIKTASSRENPRETTKNAAHSVHINSQAAVKSWQERLSIQEIERVNELTGDTASIYYSADDWQ